MGRQLNHSPAYALEIKTKWRIVVPIRGKLTPRICPEEFATSEAARKWLQSEEGTLAVDVLRSGTGRLQHPQHLNN
jgi:hypothetical protein